MEEDRVQDRAYFATSTADGGGASRVSTATLHQQQQQQQQQPRSTVIVLAENRGREVGVAICDLDGVHRVELGQFVDNQSFSASVELVDSLRPLAVVLCSTVAERVLAKKLVERSRRGMEALLGGTGTAASTMTMGGGTGSGGGGGGLGGADIVFIGRKHFDGIFGRSALKALSASPADDAAGADVEAQGGSKELAFCALAALVQFVEAKQHFSFARSSVRFAWRTGKGRMALDAETVRNLELFAGARSGSVRDSLLGAIDRTRTAVGARLLRANLLAPSCEPGTLAVRLDAVDEILRSETLFFSMTKELLPALLDVDHVFAQFAAVPNVHTPRTARNAINAIIGLKHTLELVSGVL
jgi:DNA mismatch repair ATPase MutS